MDKEVINEGISWSIYLIPIATFILGSWLVPKMSWLPESIKIWIFSSGIGLLIIGLSMTKTIQSWLKNNLPINHSYIVLGIIIIGLIITIISGFIFTNLNKDYEKRNRLKKTTNDLITEIVLFIAHNQTNITSMPDLTGLEKEEASKALYEQWKRQVEANKRKDAIFTSNYHQKITDIAYRFHQLEIISEEELKHLLWVSQPEHPTIQWILEALEKYVSRLN